MTPLALRLLEKAKAKEIFLPLIAEHKQTWEMGFDARERGIPFCAMKREAARQGWHARAKVDELAAAGIEMRDPVVWEEILDKLRWMERQADEVKV